MIDAMIGSVTRLKIYIEKQKFVKKGSAIGMTWSHLKVNPERASGQELSGVKNPSLPHFKKA
jgi:hypothetical protein